jgi:lysophospholipase L1-like esterase
MTCSGATIRHVKNGGQFFLGPQIKAIGPETRLVTITAGGNDVGYVGDLTAMAFQKRGGVVGFMIGRLWRGPKAVDDRGFEVLQRDMVATLREIARGAPSAKIVVVTYPAILPPTGACTELLLDDAQAGLMRQVAARLSEVTRAAASAVGAVVVDMERASAGHDACSPEPWVSGAAPAQGAPFHPTLAGAEATARQIMRVINAAPARNQKR